MTVGLTCFPQIVDGLFGLFEPSVPLHLLKGEEPGIDVYMFMDAVHRKFGVKPRLIHSSQLRVVRDPQGKRKPKLCCMIEDAKQFPVHLSPSILTTADGELVEEIYQVGLELRQRELFALDAEVLREVSLRCFNDLRTILLVHDKRMLGIVKQEISSLMARQVITPTQAQVLENGVADTVLPGSRELDRLVHSCEDSSGLKNEFILKPIRSGKGDGIVFGDDMSQDEWMSALRLQATSGLKLERACVVQRRIRPRLYDLILRSSGDMVRYPLVGTYHVIDGKLLGLGIWRSNGNRVCALSSGGAWACSVMPKE